MICSIPPKAQSPWACGLLDLRISSQWSKRQNDQAAWSATVQRNLWFHHLPRQGCNEAFADMSRQKSTNFFWDSSAEELVTSSGERNYRSCRNLWSFGIADVCFGRQRPEGPHRAPGIGGTRKTKRDVSQARDSLTASFRCVSSFHTDWRPPATAGYGPAPTRDNYMGMGGWNGGMTWSCGRVCSKTLRSWQKVGKGLAFRMFWEGLRPKPKSDESTWVFFSDTTTWCIWVAAPVYAWRPFDLQQAQHRVCWTSQRRQTNCNAVSNARICFLYCCTGISHQLLMQWTCKN